MRRLMVLLMAAITVCLAGCELRPWQGGPEGSVLFDSERVLDDKSHDVYAYVTYDATHVVVLKSYAVFGPSLDPDHTGRRYASFSDGTLATDDIQGSTPTAHLKVVLVGDGDIVSLELTGTCGGRTVSYVYMTHLSDVVIRIRRDRYE